MKIFFTFALSLLTPACSDESYDAIERETRSGHSVILSPVEIEALTKNPQKIRPEDQMRIFRHLRAAGDPANLPNDDPNYWLDRAVTQGYGPAMQSRIAINLARNTKKSCQSAFKDIHEANNRSDRNEILQGFTSTDVEKCEQTLSTK